MVDLLRSGIQQLRYGLMPRERQLAKLRAQWAQPGDKDGWLASRYFELTRARGAQTQVDDRTWIDLEFPAIFSVIDSTVTPLGSQCLFKMLREYASSASDVSQLNSTYTALRADSTLRESIQLKLSHLQADSCAGIADFVFGEPPSAPQPSIWLFVLSLTSLVALLAVASGSLPLVAWLGLVAANAAVVLRGSTQRQRQLDTLKDCHRLLHVAEGLAALDTRGGRIPQLEQLRAQASERVRARRGLRLLRLPRDGLTESLLFWLNLAFLAELLVFPRTLARFVAARRVFGSTFALVGSIDAAIALASYVERHPSHCEPRFTESALIELRDGYHPLISAPVKNSLRLEQRSALVTGSNMAGKTTFIKMIGVNLILGRTVGFCMAASAVIPWSRVMASIRNEHSVAAGTSHYFAEIDAIHDFIASAEQGSCRVFVIDELFSGTNTLERLAVARAVLETLNKTAQVLVTTHDIELQGLLRSGFDHYHFRENPDVDGFFDYELQSGPTMARNAIRLLERLGFPSAVVAQALSYTTDAERAKAGQRPTGPLAAPTNRPDKRPDDA